jgi:hypothetical protein
MCSEQAGMLGMNGAGSPIRRRKALDVETSQSQPREQYDAREFRRTGRVLGLRGASCHEPGRAARDGKARAGVIEYLRDLEAVALREGSSREALQVIASGRRLLGDRSEAAPAEIARAVRTILD